MSNTYSKHFNTKTTPQTEKIPGSKQVQNSEGGYSFPVDQWTRLERFVILGSEKGSYYAKEAKLTKDNATNVVKCVQDDGLRALSIIVNVSKEGRAVKNDPAIFCLALAASFGSDKTKTLALEALPAVARTGTDLFSFVQAVDGLRGWGPMLRAGVANWYASRDSDNLTYQVVKYQQRNGWSHKDVLRLCHAKFPASMASHQAVARYVSFGFDGLAGHTTKRKHGDEIREVNYPAISEDAVPRLIYGVEAAKKASNVVEIIRLIEEYNLPRECVPTQFLNEKGVWESLLRKMPLNAMVRNLGKMTSIGLLTPLSRALKKVTDSLEDSEYVKRSRLHPLKVLVALNTYKQGRGHKGSLTWSPVPNILAALDGAFYHAFKGVEPTGKRWMLALDISASMCSPEISGMPGITPRIGSAAMALVTAAVEKQHYFVGFSHYLTPLNIGPKMGLTEVINNISNLPFGGTDCGLPMRHAIEKNLEVDAFVVYTDNETKTGPEHPVQSLRKYRQKTGIPAKLIVVGMLGNAFTIADPDDAGMLDVVGFDTSAPAAMSGFVGGKPVQRDDDDEGEE